VKGIRVDRMASAKLVVAKVLRVPAFVTYYINAKQKRLSPQAVPLTQAQRAAMGGFFLPQVLDAARLLVREGVRLEYPPFYRTLRRMGLSGLPHMSKISAMTFGEVVVSHVPFTDGLLFHELVHVEQYRQLGIRRFSELYVQGFLSGGYDGIPLEVNARALRGRFEGNPRQQFSVAEEVARWIREDRF